jgi:hypothetical protein
MTALISCFSYFRANEHVQSIFLTAQQTDRHRFGTSACAAVRACAGVTTLHRCVIPRVGLALLTSFIHVSRMLQKCSSRFWLAKQHLDASGLTQHDSAGVCMLNDPGCWTCSVYKWRHCLTANHPSSLSATQTL